MTDGQSSACRDQIETSGGVCETCGGTGRIAELELANNKLHTECGHLQADIAELRSRTLTDEQRELARVLASWFDGFMSTYMLLDVKRFLHEIAEAGNA